MDKKVQELMVELLERLRGYLDTYSASMKKEVGVTLPRHIFRANRVLQEIEEDLPGMFEILKNEPSHMRSLHRDEKEWGSVVLVDLLMEVFVKDMVLTKPPQTVALILTTLFEDIQSEYVPPADAFYGVMGNLVVAFGMPQLTKKYKWRNPKKPHEKTAYKYFVKVINDLLHSSQLPSSDTVSDSSSGSRSRTI
ncbi:hypothetical protein E2C01_051633 [Portunus trituberculatus]|uniref:Uncharacterized protein n=1 Tax=Portunus trituberculatus TaxID=210409 RepID=A0A5B7GKV3_PORTR|nr:hypothetical protein [Portunus trituberculatus]